MRLHPRIPRTGALLAWVLVVSASPLCAQYLTPTPYLSFGDSPFAAGSFSFFYLEDFEDGLLNSAGVEAPGTWLVQPTAGPNSFIDSVDGDDGAVDGSGMNGFSLYPAANSISFVFDAAILGSLPTHAGLVWTDVGFSLPGSTGLGDVFFEAFGPTGTSLGVFGPFLLGDGTALSATAEDRFFGAMHTGGISRISMTMPTSIDWEVDHLQYGLVADGGGSVVPEPISLVLLATGLAGIGAVSRRRSRRLVE